MRVYIIRQVFAGMAHDLFPGVFIHSGQLRQRGERMPAAVRRVAEAYFLLTAL